MDTAASADELQRLEGDHIQRMPGLNEDDSVAVYADLEAFWEDYPKLQASFEE